MEYKSVKVETLKLSNGCLLELLHLRTSIKKRNFKNHIIVVLLIFQLHLKIF